MHMCVCRRPSVGQAHRVYCACGAQVRFTPPVTGDFAGPHQELSVSTGRNMWSGGEETTEQGRRVRTKECLRKNLKSHLKFICRAFNQNVS